MLYCLRNPKGKLIEWAADTEKDECWGRSFIFLYENINSFRSKYWQHERASKLAAKKLGYEIVKCELMMK